MSEDQNTKGSQPSILQTHWLNIVILIIMILLFTWWCKHHFNTTEWYVWLVAATSLSFTIFSKFISSLGATDENYFKKITRNFLIFILQFKVIFFVFILLVIPVILFSSVTVHSEQPNKKFYLQIKDKPISLHDSSGISNEFENSFNYVKFTYPGGKKYYFQVNGYQPDTFILHPIIGKVIIIPRDLKPLPALLFRLPGPGESKYMGGRLLLISHYDTIMNVPYSNGKLSFQIGRVSEITDKIKESWDRVLVANGATEMVASNLVEAWSTPNVSNQMIVLMPGDSITAIFLNRVGNVKGKASDIITGTEEIQDILLEE